MTTATATTITTATTTMTASHSRGGCRTGVHIAHGRAICVLRENQTAEAQNEDQNRNQTEILFHFDYSPFSVSRWGSIFVLLWGLLAVHSDKTVCLF